MTRRLNDLQQTNVLLFNALLRHQLYVDGVKTHFSAEYVVRLRKLASSFADFFARNRYSTLDQFTKGQLNEFLRQFQREQAQFYNRYFRDLMQALQDFLAVDIQISTAVFQKAEDTHPVVFPGVFGAAAEDDKAHNEALFSKIVGEPMPANGVHVADQIKAFARYANFNVLALIRQGYANGWTPEETLAKIVGEQGTFKDGLFGRLINNNSAIIATVIQHIHANVEASVASQRFEKYIWISVLDDRTTDICISRAGVVYIYGEGPLPPAHWGCRSTIVPETGEKAIPIPKSYYDWLVNQPASFQDDLLGSIKASLLRAGKLPEGDFSSIGTVKPLTLTEFADKIRHILQGE